VLTWNNTNISYQPKKIPIAVNNGISKFSNTFLPKEGIKFSMSFAFLRTPVARGIAINIVNNPNNPVKGIINGEG